MQTQELNRVRQRRFEEVHKPNPGAVKGLHEDHTAMLLKRSMFPSMSRAVADEPVLKSGEHNRKIGRIVTKGPWRAYPIYTLTLEERATCPAHCHMLAECYGNAMQWSPRWQHGPALEKKLRTEVAALAKEHFRGFVVRLHVLGDFYSPEYAALWRELLGAHKSLHVYGYTAHRLDAQDERLRDIALVIDNTRLAFPERFVIRESHREPGPNRAVVIARAPEGPKVAEGTVCPAETDRTACCTTCGLCWAPEMRDQTIVFLKHGLGSKKSDLVIQQINDSGENNARPVRAIETLSRLAVNPLGQKPEIVWLRPTELWVDERYQRNLSRASHKLITKIVTNWNWAHYKLPIVTKCPETGRFQVIDGQHTAIAAATRHDIDFIPVAVVDGSTLQVQATAFVAHNRDRIAMTATQRFHSLVVAGDPEAVEIMAICRETGTRLLKHPPVNGIYKAGDTMALNAIQSILRKHGRPGLVKTLTALKHCAPIRSDNLKSVSKLLSEPAYAGDVSIGAVQALTQRWDENQMSREARELSQNSGIPLWQAKAILIYQAISK